MNKKIITLAVLLISPILFAGTGYRYVPPDSDYGRLCVNQCESSKYQCKQLEQIKQENAELREAQDDLYWGQDDIRYDQECFAKYADDKKKQKKKCGYDDIDDILSGLELFSLIVGDEEGERAPDVCKNRYLTCFKTCGGRIETVNFDDD